MQVKPSKSLRKRKAENPKTKVYSQSSFVKRKEKKAQKKKMKKEEKEQEQIAEKLKSMHEHVKTLEEQIEWAKSLVKQAHENEEIRNKRETILLGLIDIVQPTLLGKTLRVTAMEKTHHEYAVKMMEENGRPLLPSILHSAAWTEIVPPFLNLHPHGQRLSFATFEPSEELYALREQAISFLQILQRDFPHIIRGEDKTGYQGECYGFGWRPGTDKGKRYGLYRIKPGNTTFQQ
jgi:hypothetical protein